MLRTVSPSINVLLNTRPPLLKTYNVILIHFKVKWKFEPRSWTTIWRSSTYSPIISPTLILCVDWKTGSRLIVVVHSIYEYRVVHYETEWKYMITVVSNMIVLVIAGRKVFRSFDQIIMWSWGFSDGYLRIVWTCAISNESYVYY